MEKFIHIQGKYNEAKIYADFVEQTALSQLYDICNHEISEDSKIRVMPDVHAGKGSTIGFTMEIKDKVVPEMVGVDIGCGMTVYKVPIHYDFDYVNLDNIIREKVPCGFNIHEKAIKEFSRLNDLTCINELKNVQNFEKGIGTLGGGNHFIEIGNSVNSMFKYLIVHSGSRNLGNQVAIHHTKIAKAGGQGGHIAYLTGVEKENYLNDMQICQEYASLNRKTIVEVIRENAELDKSGGFVCETVHNYIDFDTMILRKGAVSALDGELMLIPMNMQFGSVLCFGKGNAEWNYSAPHGAGRLFSRGKAKEELSLEEFEKDMSGIFTTCVGKSTLDEAPRAYKSPFEVLDRIEETADIADRLVPVYNFKA